MPAVHLRPWRDEDAAAVAPIIDDPHLLRWSRMSELGLGRWITEQRAGTRGPSLAICRPDDDRPLGKIALRLPGHASPATSCEGIRGSDHPVGELSYWILPHARGHGLAGDAVRAMADRARQTTDLRSLVMDIEIDNLPSIRVADRLGAERREPPRVELDRAGVPRTMVVFVLAIL
jgi:ribosomal-protein-alanine N-acetyltransferase